MKSKIICLSLLATSIFCAVAQDTPQPPSEPIKEAEKKLDVIQAEISQNMKQAEQEQLSQRVEDLETHVKELQASLEELEKKVNDKN